MIAGGLRAWRQYDLKLLLAYGTVSQLGFLFVLFGTGIAGADARRRASCSSPTRSSRRRCSWWSASSTTRPARATSVGSIASPRAGTRCASSRSSRAASMAGIPLTLGFLAKESAYDAFCARPIGGAALVLTARGRRLVDHRRLQRPLRRRGVRPPPRATRTGDAASSPEPVSAWVPRPARRARGRRRPVRHRSRLVDPLASTPPSARSFPDPTRAPRALARLSRSRWSSRS